MKVVLVAGAPSSSLSGSHTSFFKFRLGSPAVSLLASTCCQKSSDTFLNLVFGSLNPATILDKGASSSGDYNPDWSPSPTPLFPSAHQ